MIYGVTIAISQGDEPFVGNPTTTVAWQRAPNKLIAKLTLIASYIYPELYGYIHLFSGCNRTYYGDIGQTYALELHRPKQDRVPFVCVLTFTAAGGQHGDVVQVSQGRGITLQYTEL